MAGRTSSRSARSGAQRQAAFAERRRRRTPLERHVNEAAGALYTADELAILARIRRSRDQLLADCARLNRRVQVRLLAASLAPGACAEERSRLRAILVHLRRRTYLALPVH